MDELDGKVVAITGGASGIGRALADAFGGAGMKVALADIEAGPLETAVAELTDAGVDASGWTCDVSDDDQVHAFAAATFERFGTAHMVCNNAGVGGAGGLTWEVPLAGWEWTIGVNLMGVVHGIRAFVPRLVEQGEGHVVNTASLAGLKAAPFMAAYNATKHAVVAISESLAHECAMTAPGVGVSVLCPAFIRTRIAESGRNWPAHLGENPSPAADSPASGMMRQLVDNGLEPSVYAARVVDAVHTNRFFVLSDDAHAERDAAPARRDRRRHPAGLLHALSQGRPAPGTVTSHTSMAPRIAPVAAGSLASAVQTKSVVRSGPPSMHTYAPRRSTVTMSVTAPPSHTRRTRPVRGHADQIAPSASRQMPSGTAPSSLAHSRRPESVPSAATSKAVSSPDQLSPMISVAPSGVITVPFGKRNPSAATAMAPSGSTRTRFAVEGGAPPSRSKPKLPT